MNGDKIIENGCLSTNKITVVLGAQWGDEGKGKVVDLLAKDADLVCRCQVNRYKFLFAFYKSQLASFENKMENFTKLEEIL